MSLDVVSLESCTFTTGRTTKSYSLVAITGVCPEGEYFSFVSSECIPVRKMCDGSIDTSRGDDELGCGKYYFPISSHSSAHVCVSVALSNNNRLELDHKARPKHSKNGTVFFNSGGRWQLLCASDFTNTKTQSICTSLGYQ